MDPEKIAAELATLNTTMRFFDATMQRVERKVDALDTKVDGILPVCAEHGRQIAMLEQAPPRRQHIALTTTQWSGIGAGFIALILGVIEYLKTRGILN